MAEISLTDFVDIVSKSGRPKATKIIEVKERPDYAPAFDYYKPVRDAIIEYHKSNLSKEDLKSRIQAASNTRRLPNHLEALDGYLSFLGRKRITWFDPPRSLYTEHGISIRINPELGLVIKDIPYVVKLYFKRDSLTRSKVEIINALMLNSLQTQLHNSEALSVLDVRANKHIVHTSSGYDPMKMINAELGYISELWN